MIYNTSFKNLNTPLVNLTHLLHYCTNIHTNITPLSFSMNIFYRKYSRKETRIK